MKDIKGQIRLLKKVRTSRPKYESREAVKRHQNHILMFVKKHSLLIWGTLILFVSQGIIETFLLFISKNRLSFRDSGLISTFFWQLFIGLIILFIVNSFFSIKQEKTIIVLFINNLRRRIFKNYLGKTLDEMTSEKQADLIAKVSYHLPLVSMGISNSVFGIVRWLIILLSTIVVAYLAGLNIWLITISFIILSVVIAVSAYFVVKKYVSQEVTFYSQILKHIDFSLSEKYFSKSFNLEPVILKKFDNLVNFDSIFRVRRDLWIKMSFSIIFILVLIISIFSNLFYDSLAIKINLISPELKFLYFFLVVYLSRIIRESLRIGLYFFPAKLGLSLTNVKTEKYNHRDNFIKLKQEISFYSRKVKFFKLGKYYKDLVFNFKKSGRYLFYGSSLSGKTTLAKVFLGNDFPSSKALKVRIDGIRLDFSDYQRKFNDIYFFDPKFYSSKSLIEIITGSSREETAFSDIQKALKIAADNEWLSKLVSDTNNLNISAINILGNNLSSFALSALHCLFKKPAIIIIDNLWLDLNSPEIDKILNLISANLPDSIIIVFAKNNISNLSYNQRYYIDKDFNYEK